MVVKSDPKNECFEVVLLVRMAVPTVAVKLDGSSVPLMLLARRYVFAEASVIHFVIIY